MQLPRDAVVKQVTKFLSARLDVVELVPALRLQILTGSANAALRSVGLHQLLGMMQGTWGVGL